MMRWVFGGGVDHRSIGRFVDKFSRAELEIIESSIGRVVRAFGYDFKGVKAGERLRHPILLKKTTCITPVLFV
jgi:hypothetical protein